MDSYPFEHLDYQFRQVEELQDSGILTPRKQIVLVKSTRTWRDLENL
jgi:hypothetical protein